MHNCNWKYEYEVEHNRLVYAQTEIKKLRDTLEWVIAEAQRQKEALKKAVQEEREGCAVECTNVSMQYAFHVDIMSEGLSEGAKECAEAIRGRGERE